MTPLCLRRASAAAAQGILDIYAPYVERTVVTFEYDGPPEKPIPAWQLDFRAVERILRQGTERLNDKGE